MTGTAVLLLLWSVTSVWSATVHIYVSPTGSDSNDGRQSSHPVKTLHHVVDMLDNDGIRGNAVFVELMGGYYDLTSTVHVPSTYGTTVFRAYQGQEVHLVGGKRIPSSQFHHVSDPHVQQRLPQVARGKVLELDLTAAGITDLGIIREFGWFRTWTAPLEIFINGKPLRLAEWPNYNFINIKTIPDGEHGRTFTYDSDGRDVYWANETEPWAYGYWYKSYADMAIPIGHVDPQTHTITMKVRVFGHGLHPGHYDPSGDNKNAGGQEQGGYFRVMNMLCEIDQPGEYFIDRRSKKLYVWPNTPHQTLTSSDIVYASLVDDCVTVDSQAQDLHFEDFTVEACRRWGFELRDARRVTLKNLEVKNTGDAGIHCSKDCRELSILASEFHDVGGGIQIEGGDRLNLTSSENVIRDNHVWDHARYGAQPNHGIEIGGVHATVSYNHVHHGQYNGIWFTGNEHVIEYNHIHHMCINASDCGAIYSYQDWTFRGTVIRGNHIHDVYRYMPGAPVWAVMLDDEFSSAVVENNVFYNNEVHVDVGAGRDNVVRYNVMYNALVQSMQVDGRGFVIDDLVRILQTNLQKVPYRMEPWKSRYPKLYSILDHQPEAPEERTNIQSGGNQIYNNVFYNKEGIETVHYTTYGVDRSDYYDVHDNFWVYAEDEFWSPSDADFRLRCDAAQWGNTVNFPRPLTLNEVGPRVPTGPHYLRVQRHTPTVPPTSSPRPCDNSTVAPATDVPRVSYMPDGSAPNTLYPNIAKEGCWFVVDHCPSHPTAEGTHKDDVGTQAGTEEGCLARAAQQWKWCGSPDNGRVVAVYGPTGSMTFATKGCYFAEYGCQTPHAGFFQRDNWAEQHEDAAVNETKCLGRALEIWNYCGSSYDRPVTCIYGPTGAFRTVGAGCWIKIPSCPADHDLEGFFFDAWGESNRHTGTEREECHYRATYFWSRCGSHDNAPVTAYFRPDGTSHAVP